MKRTDRINRTTRGVGRRDFMAGIGALAAGASFAQTPSAAQAGPPIKIGLIGCGGRGLMIGKMFRDAGGYEVVAVADYFADRTKKVGDELGVPDARRFDTLSGYKRILDAGCDAVAIETPPCFHVDQTRDAVDAGCHVFLAKPVAVDVPGSKAIADLGLLARQKKLCLLVDFQTRADPFYREAVRLVHEGAIGRIAFVETYYHAGRLRRDAAADDSPEGRLRNWVFDKRLSGDIITEQNVHTLDVLSWVMNTTPLHAFGACGRKVRTDVGDANDYFTLHFLYPDHVGVTFSSRQFEGHGTKPDGIVVRAFGDLGVLETAYGGNVMIRGKNFYRGGASPAIYREGAMANIVEFGRCIREGDVSNPTVEPSVRSNMVTILGREAAYSGGLVDWNRVARSTESWDPGLKGLKA